MRRARRKITVARKGRQARPPGIRHRRSRQARRRHHGAGAGRDGLGDLRSRNRAASHQGQVPRLRSRLQYPFQIHQAARRRKCFHDRAEGTRPSRSIRIHQGPRRAVPARGRAGSVGRHHQSRTRIWQRNRWRTRGDYRNLVQGRNRNRSFRRAIRPMRRTHRADSRRLRDAGRSRLRARDGVLRIACTK